MFCKCMCVCVSVSACLVCVCVSVCVCVCMCLRGTEKGPRSSRAQAGSVSIGRLRLQVVICMWAEFVQTWWPPDLCELQLIRSVDDLFAGVLTYSQFGEDSPIL